MRRSVRAGMCVLLVVGTLFASDAGLASHQEVTVDFSTHGEGIFDPTFYEPQGLVFPPLIWREHRLSRVVRVRFLRG